MFGNKKQTVSIYVKSEPFDYLVKYKPIIKEGDGRSFVIVRKESKNAVAWKLEITNALRVNQFGKNYVEAFEDSPTAILFEKTNPLVSRSPLTEMEKQTINKMNIFKAHYGKLLGDLLSAIKPFLFGMILIGIFAIVAAGVSAYYSYQVSNYIQNFYLVR